jgi:hypothetical protein
MLGGGGGEENLYFLIPLFYPLLCYFVSHNEISLSRHSQTPNLYIIFEVLIMKITVICHHLQSRRFALLLWRDAGSTFLWFVHKYCDIMPECSQRSTTIVCCLLGSLGTFLQQWIGLWKSMHCYEINTCFRSND